MEQEHWRALAGNSILDSQTIKCETGCYVWQTSNPPPLHPSIVPQIDRNPQLRYTDLDPKTDTFYVFVFFLKHRPWRN